MIRKWNIALTYEPKIEPVKEGMCTQTIRVVGKKGHKKEGDLVSFHGWKGRPHWSSWSWRIPYKEIWMAERIQIIPTGFLFYHNGKFQKEVFWDDYEMGDLAKKDYIDPPTGAALHDVLVGKNGKIPNQGYEAQIIRWLP